MTVAVEIATDATRGQDNLLGQKSTMGVVEG